MFTTYLLLGSNLGDSVQYLADASLLITQKCGVITAQSSLYKTASWGKNDQPDFINQVVKLDTRLSAADLLRTVLAIEESLGRLRVEKWGSRIIDIDILTYEDQVIDHDDLKVPHPFLHERRFVLEPLCEIAPDLRHPVLHKTIKELLSELSDNLFVKKLY